MILAHFGLRTLPFTREIPTAQLFVSPQHQELLARLQYIVQHRAFGFITGDVGAGKSTTVRALYDQLDRTRHQFFYIADSRLTPTAFYRDILSQFGVSPPFQSRETKRLFESTILDGYRVHNRQPIIVLDEAHLLSGAILQEIRFLLNFHMDSISPLSFVLVGQTELRGTMRLRAFEAIAQRVQVRYHLTGLGEQETAAYIQHHLRVAGADRQIFSEHAIRAIAEHSRGLPRTVNSLCTACLLDACSHDQQVIDQANVDRVVLEFQDTQPVKAAAPW